MESAVVKRSVVIAGHKTSISLEAEFWEGLKFVAGEKNLKISKLLTTIEQQGTQNNLSSAVRLFVFRYFVSLIPDKEHVGDGMDAQPRTNEGAGSLRFTLPPQLRKA
jgi:predicted DNA-binding ribbon-helix-helix protein